MKKTAQKNKPVQKTTDKSPKTTADKLTLEVKKRDIFGKKLKALRKQGILPANIFAEDIKSQAININTKEFNKIYRKAGETQIVYLVLNNEELPVLIQNAQKHPVTDAFLHVEFRKVNLAKKLEIEAPVKFIGESDAVVQNKGVILTLTETLLVEALPNAIPKTIEVDISSLKELNDEIKVKNLTPVGDYIFKDSPEKVIVRISQHKEESVETTQVAAPESVEVTTEKADETETAEEKKETAPQSKEEIKKESKKEEKK